MASETQPQSLQHLIELEAQQAGGGQPAGSGSADDSMMLAAAGPAGGGGGGAGGDGLQHSEGPWTHGATVVGELKADTNSGMTKLETAHGGVSSGAEGLETTAALSAVLYSWQQRLKTVREECGNLEAPLRLVAKDQGEFETYTAGKFTQVVPAEGRDKGGR
ncbi:hypothetical protein ACWDZ6_21980 [Streptomyces sp. NPDC002926]